MTVPDSTVKLCECGCGQPTTISTKTNPRRGWVKGQPRRFLHRHSMRLSRAQRDADRASRFTPRLCGCGCGHPTKQSIQKQNGYTLGEYQRFVFGHNRRVHLRTHCKRGHDVAAVNKGTRFEDADTASYCAECLRVASRKREARLRETEAGRRLMRQQQRKSTLKTQYGMTEADYETLLDAQDGRCAICRQPPPSYRPILHVDHDHDRGTVRGLLCSDCNLAIGKLHDSIDLLRAAVDYLARSQPAPIRPAV